MSCLFCNIAAGATSSYRIYEDEATYAFLDVHPSSPGHTLIIPKMHASTILDLAESDGGKLMETVKKVVKRMEEVLGVDACNIGWNHGGAAGQVVAHLHIHVIPRSAGDGGKSVQAVVHKESDKTLEELARMLSFS